MKLSELKNNSMFVLIKPGASSLLKKFQDGRIYRIVETKSRYSSASELSQGSDKGLENIGLDTEVQEVRIEGRRDYLYISQP